MPWRRPSGGRSACRFTSRWGDSTLTTSAPRAPRYCAAIGPAAKWVNAATRMWSSAVAISGVVLLQLARDDHALDLIGAVPDLVDFGVAVVALDRIFLGVGVSAEDLHRVGDIAHAHVAREELGVGRLLAEWQP